MYLTEHQYAVQWAIANRDLVAYRFKQCIFARLDSDESTLPQPSELRKIVDVTHNSVTKQFLTVGDELREFWVHRKGAAPATGAAPCPGSRGDFSWLLEPIGDGQLNGQLSKINCPTYLTNYYVVHSLAHGAGRRHARHVLHTGAKRAKSSLTTTSLGSEVICTNADLLIEEMPEAYKDVGTVVEDMVDKVGLNFGKRIRKFLINRHIRRVFARELWSCGL